MTDTPGAPGSDLDLDETTDDELHAAVSDLERQAVPLQEQLTALRAKTDALRTELRRRLRLGELRQRQGVRAELAAGRLPSLEDLVSGRVEPGGSDAYDDHRLVRESATEVRLGYASSSRQSISFTDGRNTEEAADLGAARTIYAKGWDFGTPQARGVRIYPVGTRAERVVPAAEIHVESR